MSIDVNFLDHADDSNNHRSSEPKPPPLCSNRLLTRGGVSRVELRFEDFEQIWTILGRLRRILPLYTPENLIFFARLRRATFFSILPLYTPKTKIFGRLRRPLLTKFAFVYP